MRAFMYINPLMTKSAEPGVRRGLQIHVHGASEASTDSVVPEDKPGIALLVY